LFSASAISSRPRAVRRWKAQFEDAARLRLGEAVFAVVRQPVAWIGDQRDERRHVFRRPGTPHQRLACCGGVGRRADETDHFVDVGDGDRKADLQMRCIAGLGEKELGAPRHDLFAEVDERDEDIAQVHELRAAAG
jgi:hypothetical protein